jgi:hypothetical protein
MPEEPILDEIPEPTPDRIIDLGDGVFARILRVDEVDICFDLGTVAGDVFTATAERQGVPPVPGFDPEEPPDDEDLAAHIADKLANPIPVVPRVVSRAQFMHAVRSVLGMADSDLYALVEAMDAGAAKNKAHDLAHHAREFRRDNATLIAMATAESITSAQLDALFTTAAGLDLDS